jgi:SAM-dependent methyltransferase
MAKRQAWDEIFKRDGRVFQEPHPDIPPAAQRWREQGRQRVLDLGCGSGRHVVYLAQNGFKVWGLDNSPRGLALTQQWLSEKGLVADLRLGDMTARLPYADDFFDAVISVQVIHHARAATIRHIVQEVERVLKQDGFVFISVPRLRNQGLEFEQVEPNTFVPLDGPEKGLPHHYFTPEELREFFGNFRVSDMHLDAVNHYCLSAHKR